VDFETASRLGALISRDYAQQFFKLLVVYQDISASEAASRLNIHVKTAQDFLEGLHRNEILSRREVIEKKRPYFRYSLAKTRVTIEVELSMLHSEKGDRKKLQWKIKERKHSGSMFKTFGKSDRLSAIHFFTGEGRSRKEIRLNLTGSQGNFLYYLPFPTESAAQISEIIEKSGVEPAAIPEILDIVEELIRYRIIERADDGH
jgi:predicted transcriptional regulator